MADYFLQFSCTLDVGSPENVARAIDIRGELATEMYRDEGGYLGFEMEASQEEGSGALWIHGDDYGEPEHVITFVLRCAEAFDLSGLWGFHWALTCSRPRLDAFGGGAQLLDLGKRQSVAWVDCEHWLAEQLGDQQDRETGVEPNAVGEEATP